MATPENENDQRRREAMLAMEGEEHRAKRLNQERETLRRRREAMLAMEGEEHRRKRETAEKKLREESARARAAEAERARREAEVRAKAQAETEAAKKQAAKTETAKQKKLGEIEEASSLVEKLKAAGTILSPIRTLKSDLARAVREEGLSIAKIAITEQVKRQLRGKTKREGAPTKEAQQRKNRLLPLLVILTLAAGAGLFNWWWRARPPPDGIPISAQTKPLIFAETTLSLDLTGLADSETIRQQIRNGISQAQSNRPAITAFLFNRSDRPLDWLAFRQAVGLTMPESLTRQLTEQFMLGFYQNGELKTPFLILKTRFFERAWSEMLAWEQTLAGDVWPLLGTGARPAAASGSFKDKLLRNKDARILLDNQSRPILLYAFLDAETLLFTRNEETFIEVFKRFVGKL